MEPLSQVERLVQLLYRPSTPVEVNQIQKQLQEAQKSAGWQLAEGLKGSDDQNVRFFAALTYTVKLNQEGATLGEDELEALLSDLLEWLIKSVNGEETLLVLNKLCSTLVTLFLLPKATWRLCIRNIMCCIAANAVIPEADIDGYPSTSSMLQRLAPRQISFLVVFAKMLSEDATRIEHNSQHFNFCHERVASNLNDAVLVIHHAFGLVQRSYSDFSHDVFGCFQSWLTYIRQEYSESSDQVMLLRSLSATAVQCLMIEPLFQDAADFFIDLFGADDGFFSFDETYSFSRLLTDNLASNRLGRLQEDDLEDEVLLFAQLASIFAQASTKFLVQYPATFELVTGIMHQITAAQRFGTVDQTLANTVVEFWESYNMQASDIAMEDESARQCLSSARQQWLQAIEELCLSSALPLDNMGDLIRLSLDHPFSEYRGRVRTAVHSSYEVYGVVVLEKLITLASSTENHMSTDPQSWSRLEAVFSCLGGLGDTMKYQASDPELEDSQLRILFGSSLYHRLIDPSLAAPLRLCKKAVTILGEHDEFFGRHHEFLVSALEALFRCLQHPQLADTAAKAVFTLCNANRKALGSMLTPLLNASEQFYISARPSGASKEMIAATIAAIAQSLPEEEAQVRAASNLLDLLERDYQLNLRFPNHDTSAEEYLLHVNLDLLSQLRAIGKAWQMPDNEPIDLDADDVVTNGLWATIQTQLINLLGLVTGQNLHGDITEALCEVLQTGYKESKAGPFVFDASVTLNFVATTDRSTPRLDVVLRTVAIFVTSRGTHFSFSAAEVLTLLEWLSRIITPTLAAEDPELAHASIDLLSRLLSRHTEHFSQLSVSTIDLFIQLPLQCLDSAEVLTKRAAASFWTKLMNVTSSTSQVFITNVITAYGPSLVRSLIFNFGGNAARSELDWLCEPYRKLIFKHSRLPWKAWTEYALNDGAFPSTRVTDADKRKFMAQVERLRGDRKTNSVVREFWLACRGAPVAYG